ncbi:tetratricopeptide repeat protein [candidate division WOR-3 bacterium]|nr:tetratricopeptide repeat protein [candidate division WOR-3 bacterium]
MNEADFSEIARLSEKYNKDPKSRIFVQLADVYRKNNMGDEALDVLNKGLEYHPQYPVAYLILGKCHYDKRSYIQARDAFEKTIALDPQNIVALRMLAKTCEVLKDETGQINAYKSIVNIDPLDTNAKERLSMLEAIQRKEPLYTVAMAEEHEKQNNLDEALKIYENLLFSDPSDLILNQKVTELKKKVTEEKRKLEEEGIEELQIEKVFKTDELVSERAGDGAETPQPSVEGGEEPAAPTQNEIQSLEDFLVEELEQAAEKTAAQPATEDITEKTVLPTQDMPFDIPEPVEPAELKAVIEEKVEEPPPIEVPQPTEPLETTDTTPPETETPPKPKETPDGVRETETTGLKEDVVASEPQPEVSVEPPATEPVTTAPPEMTQPPEAKVEEEKKEEPKKSKEEDFKSFQEWLSGLLK